MTVFMIILLMLSIFAMPVQTAFKFNLYETCNVTDQDTLNHEKIASLRQAIFINDLDPFNVDYIGLKDSIGVTINRFRQDKMEITVDSVGKSYGIDFYNQEVIEKTSAAYVSPKLEDPVRIYFLCGHSVSALVLLGPQDVDDQSLQRSKRDGAASNASPKTGVYYRRMISSKMFMLFGFTASVMFTSLAIFIVAKRNAMIEVKSPVWPKQEDSDSERDGSKKSGTPISPPTKV